MQRYIIAWDEDSLEWSVQCIGDPDGTLPLCEFKNKVKVKNYGMEV